MTTLVLKLVLTPALIGAASLAGRRWGPALSGWLIGLPFTSGPVIFFLALSHGTAFAATTAEGTLAGTLSQVGFCLTFAWVAWLVASRRGWPAAFGAGITIFALETFALRFLALPLWMVLLIVVGALAVALRLMPGAVAPPGPRSAASRGVQKGYAASAGHAAKDGGKRTVNTAADAQGPEEGTHAANGAPPRWDLPVRMTVATVFVLALTGIAPALGAQLTGLLAPFPLFASILAVFAQMQQGPAAAAGVLRGLLLGLFSFAGFCVTVSALLVPAGIALAFAAGITLALAMQGVSLWLIRRSSA